MPGLWYTIIVPRGTKEKREVTKMFEENYDNAYELDLRELHGWDMEDYERDMEEEEDAAQEAAYAEYCELVRLFEA